METQRVKGIRIAGIILGVLALILIGLLVLGFLLPSGWSVERSTTIQAPAEEVFPYLAGAEAWSLWTPSPETGFELFGPDEGEGSGRRWDDDMYGEGEFVITAMDRPRQLHYEVAVEGGAIRIVGQMVLESVDADQTRLTWREDGDFGWNPLLGYLARRMEDLQGSQLEQSLKALDRLVTEGEPLELDEADEAPTGSPGSS